MLTPQNKNVVYRTNELISGGSLALPLRWILSAVCLCVWFALRLIAEECLE